jgi:hypothetical protein
MALMGLFYQFLSNFLGVDYSGQSDPGPFRIPLNAPIEGWTVINPNPFSGDRHIITINTDNCTLFETWNSIRFVHLSHWCKS